MLSGIVREAVANEPDMVVVGEFTESDAIVCALAAGRADVVILGTSEPEEPAVPLRFLVTSPRVKVLMLATSGRRATMYELCLHTTPLGDLSPQRLLDEIRSAPLQATTMND